jgi:hypothetical protein
MQVRCIAAVLRMVGSGQESPNVVEALLDTESNPCRPQYLMASAAPLLLHCAGYPDEIAPKWLLSSRAAAVVRAKVDSMHACAARDSACTPASSRGHGKMLT